MYGRVISDVEEYAMFLVDDDIYTFYYIPDRNLYTDCNGMIAWHLCRLVPQWLLENFKYIQEDYVCIENADGEIIELIKPEEADFLNDPEAYFSVYN